MTAPQGRGRPDDDPEEQDPGLARERTSLAWTRTAISFAALGGAALKANVTSGLLVLAVAPVVWQLGRVSRSRVSRSRAARSRAARTDLPTVGATRLFVIALTIVAVSLLCFLVAIFSRSAPLGLR